MIGRLSIHEPARCSPRTRAQSVKGGRMRTSAPFKQIGLRRGSRRFEAELAIGARESGTSLRCPFDVSLHDQVRFVYFFERSGILTDRYGEGIEADGPAVEQRDETLDDALVHLVKTILVNLQHGEGLRRCWTGDGSSGPHLGIVPHPAEQIVCDPWRPA